jgi:hypothetical protein
MPPVWTALGPLVRPGRCTGGQQESKVCAPVQAPAYLTIPSAADHARCHDDCVGEDHKQQSGETDSEDPFDRRVSDILDAEADLLREQALLLLATGSISVGRSAGTVTAQFSRPVWRHRGPLTWRRRPEYHLRAEPADGSGRHASEHGPMDARHGDRVALINEITLSLAVNLAWLEEDA